MSKNTDPSGRYFIRFFLKVGDYISPYLSFILVVIFIVPWINGRLQLHNSSEILNLIEVFVLSSATLSLLTFTYIMALADLHQKVKKSMIKSGEHFFMATVQFIVGLGLFLLVNLFIEHYMDPGNFSLSFSLSTFVFLVLLLLQFIGLYEIASALYKFLRGIFLVYRSLRVLQRPRLLKFLKRSLN